MTTRLTLLCCCIFLAACGSRTPSGKLSESSRLNSSVTSSALAESSASPAPTASPVAKASTSRDDSLSFDSLSNGTSRIKTAGNRVISDKESFATFWEEHSGSNAILPEVDFTQQTVLAVFFGQKSTGGYSIRITSIKRTGSELLVTYHESEPEKGKLNSQVINSPAHIVKISQSKTKGDFSSVRFVSD